MTTQDDSKPNYGIRLQKEAFVFSAAHFITYAGNICEPLHGHNYRVSLEINGPLDENSYVLDFIATRDALAAITGQLDHRVLLPTEHPRIQVEETSENEVIARFEDRRWVFPKRDCRLLPVANTTSELLAHWIGQQLKDALGAPADSFGLTIEVEECDGQSGICRM